MNRNISGALLALTLGTGDVDSAEAKSEKKCMEGTRLVETHHEGRIQGSCLSNQWKSIKELRDACKEFHQKLEIHFKGTDEEHWCCLEDQSRPPQS